jgi:hypothetical protein
MNKNRPPVTLYLLTIIGIILSAWLILYGLQMRFFGAFINLNRILAFLTPPQFFTRWFTQIFSGVSIGALGWPLVVIGCSLTGSVAGLWKRQSWASPSLSFFTFASLATLHWMNLLSLLLFAFARSASIQGWMSSEDAVN